MKTPHSAFAESTVHGGLTLNAGVVLPTALPTRPNRFDACHVGVVLRAVLFVEAVVGVGAMFTASQPFEWLLRFSLLTGGVLPATLAWLIAACALKLRLARLKPAGQ